MRKRGEHLNVVAVKFGSEGIADLAGLGEMVGHVKDFILRIIEMRRGKKANEEAVKKARIENANSLLDLWVRTRDLNLTPAQRQALVANIDGAQELFLDMAESGQITGAEVIAEGDSGPPGAITW
jgi:hypothetical protein